jgi:NADPH-dependent ferric siderophore reductase
MVRHQIERIRHETRRRTLTVQTIVKLTSHMLRIGFTSNDLQDFVSLSADDHIKLFFPVEGERGCMRDYTPRCFDTERGTISIDFAMHDAGPATMWAMTAKVGDMLEIGGPRGSALIPTDFDWYLFIGDETALPAIGRWVEEAGPSVQVTTVVVVDDGTGAQHFRTDALWTPVWAFRDGVTDDAAVLQRALAQRLFPSGEGFVWIAAEARIARALRTYVTEERQHPREWLKAAGYWARGQADAHESIED